MHKKGFWDTPIGLSIRWILYLPLGLVMLKITQFLSIAFLTWLFRDLRGLVIIGLLFGGLMFFFMAGAAFYAVAYLVMKICPAPRQGMAVFGVVFLCWELLIVVGSLIDHDWKTATIVVLTSAVSIVILGTLIVQSWHMHPKAPLVQST